MRERNKHFVLIIFLLALFFGGIGLAVLVADLSIDYADNQRSQIQ